jgi:hypothetical protein
MSLLSRLLCLSALIAGICTLQPFTQSAQAQSGQGMIAPLRSINAPISSPLIGQYYAGMTGTSEGLGYENSYATGGFTVPLGSDFFDAWYMLDGRGHVSTEGNFFGNLGVARRLYFKPANATIGLGIFYDYDGDQYDDFGHDFHQVGALKA